MRIVAVAIAGLTILSLAACASTGGDAPPAGPPSLARAAGSPAPPQARFYADCIAQAVANTAYDREGNTVRFRCTGAPARAFYDGLAAWSAAQGSQYDGADGRTLRFSQALQRDPSGIDGCSTDGAQDYACTVVLNVGEFLGS